MDIAKTGGSGFEEFCVQHVQRGPQVFIGQPADRTVSNALEDLAGLLVA